MSVPARIWIHLVAIALVRVKRGSMWKTCAPRSRASITHWKPTRVVLGHVRAHDRDDVRVLEVLLVVGCASSPERGPQTGDRGAVSYAGLVLDLDDAQGGAEFLDQVVLLVVQRGTAEISDGHRPVGRSAALGRLLPGRRARVDHAGGDHLHRLVERELFPLRAVRPAVLHRV